MAILPNPAEFNRVTPQVRPVVTQLDTRGVGAGDRALGATITQLADREIQRLDDVMISDAETKLMQQELTLTEEYKKVQGGDVLNPEFNKTYQDKYRLSVDAISQGLNTPAQKEKFNAIAKRRGVGFDAQRTSYAMGEADRFETTQHNARLQTITDTALSQYANPQSVAANAAALNDEIVKWGVKKGMSDPAVAAAYSKQVNGAYYNALIEQALVNNDVSTANNLYAASKNLLTLPQQQALQNRLKVSNDFTEGQKLAIEAQGMLASGKTMQDVEMYVASSATSPGAYNAAQTIFTNFQQANNKAQLEAKGTVLEMYHSSGSNAAAKQKVLGSQDYAKLTPAQRAEVIDYMENDISQDKSQARADIQFAWATENQLYARGQRRIAEQNAAIDRKFKSPEVMAKFYQTLVSPQLATMTRQEVYGMLPQLGYDNVNKILAEQKVQQDGAKPLVLDKDLIEAAMPPNLKKDTRTARVDAYNGYVKAALLEWQQNNPGKKPNLEEQKAIARSANAEFNLPVSWFGLPEGWFGTNKYTVIDEVPKNRVDEAGAKRDIIRAATAKGKTLTPEQVDEIYRRSLIPTE